MNSLLESFKQRKRAARIGSVLTPALLLLVLLLVADPVSAVPPQPSTFWGAVTLSVGAHALQ